MTRALERMPLNFIENRGQLDSRVAYYVQGRDTTLYFTADGMTLVKTEQRHEKNDSKYRLEKVSLRQGIPQTPDPGSRWVVKLDFVGANPNPKIEAADPTPAVISYFKGPKESWKAGLSTYGSIVYSDLWPGIDLVYSGTANRLKYTFLVKPGADPDQVRLAYRGVRDVRLNDAGQLEVETPAGVLQDDRPYAYQEVEGRRVEIAAEYSLDRAQAGEPHGYGFALGSYDRSKPLVLDPAVLVYCGYIGGSGLDGGYGIAVDSSGNAYVTGSTQSTESTFPVSVGPDLTYNTNQDAFVAKVNAAGTALVYCGYIGGSGFDQGYGIAVDSSGNAYVSGYTDSTPATFPVTIGPDLTYNGGLVDAFVAKVNAAGTALVYCGYIGGSGDDYGFAIAVDSSGSAYVTGQTSSTESTFPVTVGPDLTYNGGSYDVFVAKVNAAGTALVYCGYIGGSGEDDGYGIAVDSSGHAHVSGQTNSTEATFPVTVGPDLTYNGGFDAFVAKVKADGTGLDYCGYIGGSGTDQAIGIAVDSSNNAYVTGFTFSAEATFPVTVGPDLTQNGGTDAFVAKVNAAGTALVYCGYIGGSGVDVGFGIAVDGSNNAYVTGYTASTEATFPVTVGPDLTHNGGGSFGSDAFVAKVNAAGTALAYCGYIGGSSDDFGRGIAVDSSGNAYVTGYTSSTEATFPVTVGPDLTYNGGSGNVFGLGDAFVAKVGGSAQPAGLVEDAHATGATISNVNSVLEPGETVLVNPSWKNVSASPLGLTGTASAFTGPAGATYTLLDTAADYGTIAPGVTADSFTAGGPSYRLSVSNPGTRPAAHWDATFLETLSTGQAKTWLLHVGQSFTDVPTSNVSYASVENIFHNGITTGCGSGIYCPNTLLPRWQMAIFLARSTLGPGVPIPISGSVSGVGPYNCTGGGISLFTDVPTTDVACPAIHFIYSRGVTTGCGSGIYCPNTLLPRWQMAIFLARSMLGPGVPIPISGTVSGVGPYNCTSGGTSLFTDVPKTDVACPAIHYIYSQGVTTGCGPGIYCPNTLLPRWQMAIFLVRAFHMPFLR